MRAKKYFLLFLPMVVSLRCLGGAGFAATPLLRICHVSSPLGKVLPRANEDIARYGGFQLAIGNFLAEHPRLNVEFKVLDVGSQLSSDGVGWADRLGCHVIVGLVSSRDALIAAPELKERKIIAFSSTASTDLINIGLPYIKSAAVAASTASLAIVRYAKQNHIKNVSAIYDAEDIYSLSYLEVLQKHLDVKPLKLNESKLLSTPEIQTGHFNEPTLLVYTTYPIASIPSLVQLAKTLSSEQKQKITMMGTNAWMENQVLRTIKPELLSFPHIFVVTAWDRLHGKKRFAAFGRKYVQRFHRVPDHDSSYDFDVTNQILTCFSSESASSDLRASMFQCLDALHAFTGVAGSFAFRNGSAHADRKVTLMKVNPDGMIMNEDKP